MKRIILATVSVLLTVMAWAGNGVAVSPAVDSLSSAVATMLGSQLKTQMQRNYGNDAAAASMFAAGVDSALHVGDKAAFHSGVFYGIMMMQRVDEMNQMGLPVDKDVMFAWLGRFLKGDSTLFTVDGSKAHIDAYIDKIQAQKLGSQQEFLDRQLSRPGVIKTSSGLVFETVKEGTGRQPQTTDKVKVLYKGRLADGTVFDSTDDDGPIEFDVNRLVKGFTEGLLLMKEGGVYRLFIPSHLGYGERGAGGVIPPNAALDFEVTLIEIVNKQK